MEVQGFADGRFGRVRECFAGILAAQPGTGSAFAVWCDGRLVVDLWGGYADAGRCRRWEADSLVQPYSVSKPFAAVCALRLVQAGRLDLDAPVRRYWPGFRAPATVRQVLCHQAGVVMLDRPAPTEAFYDWDWLCALLAVQQPAWPPGTAPVDPADQFPDQVPVEQRRFAVCGPGLPGWRLRRQQRAQPVPVVEGLGGHRPVQHHHPGLMREHLTHRRRGTEPGPVSPHRRVQVDPPGLD